MLCFIPALLPPPAQGYELYEGWQRRRRRQQADQQWDRLNQPATIQEGNEDGVQEIHGAVSRENCRKMAENFRRQGRKVKLVNIIPSSNPGATLRFNCVFEGEDAQAGWYDEKRY